MNIDGRLFCECTGCKKRRFIHKKGLCKECFIKSIFVHSLDKCEHNNLEEMGKIGDLCGGGFHDAWCTDCKEMVYAQYTRHGKIPWTYNRQLAFSTDKETFITVKKLIAQKRKRLEEKTMGRIYFNNKGKTSFTKKAEEGGADYVDTEDFRTTIAVFKGAHKVAVAVSPEKEVFFGSIDTSCDNFDAIGEDFHYDTKEFKALLQVIDAVKKSKLVN